MNKKITLALLATLVCAMQLLAAPGKIRNASITQDASCTGPGNPNEKILQIMLSYHIIIQKSRMYLVLV